MGLFSKSKEEKALADVKMKITDLEHEHSELITGRIKYDDKTRIKKVNEIEKELKSLKKERDRLDRLTKIKVVK